MIALLPLALTEPHGSAVLLSLLGLLALLSVLFSGAVDRLGIPVLLLFLVLGMLGGSEGIGQIAFSDYQLSFRLGTAALVLILFDGGFDTTVSAVRHVLYPAALLATVGVAATAALVALFAHLLGVPWAQAMLLGAVVSSTDAAAVFAVLRAGSLRLPLRVGRTIEVESCVNDPMAVILTTVVIGILSTRRSPGWNVAGQVVVQLAVGGGVGLLWGLAGKWLMRRLMLTTTGLYPVFTLALAFLSYGSATLVYGSGFLSVFLTGVVLGNAHLPNRSGLARVHNALAWMSQVGMFLMLGLLVYPSRLMEVAPIGLATALFLGFVARPLAVLPCLLPFRYRFNEIAFLGWAGLRGALPIILATFPVMANVPGGERLFDTVFFIVVISSIVPGSTLRWMTRKMHLDLPARPAPQAVLEINSLHPLNGQLLPFLIEPVVAVCGAALRQVELPPGASVVLIVRDDQMLAARGDTVLQSGDHAYVFFNPADQPSIDLLFGNPET